MSPTTYSISVIIWLLLQGNDKNTPNKWCHVQFLFVLNPEEKDMYRYSKYHLPVKFGIQAWIFWFNFMLYQILQFRLVGWKQPLNKLLILVIFFVLFYFYFLSLVNTHACSQHTAQVLNQIIGNFYLVVHVEREMPYQ